MKKRPTKRRNVEEEAENAKLLREVAALKAALAQQQGSQEHKGETTATECLGDDSEIDEQGKNGHVMPAVLEGKRRLQFLADNLPDSMFYQILVDPQGQRHFIYLSAGVERIHGITPEQAYADPMLLYEQIYKTDLSRLLTSEDAALHSRIPFSEEVRFRKPTGELGWMLLRSSPRPMLDGSTIWDGVEIDISAGKKTEEALQRQADEFHQLMKRMANAFVIWRTVFDNKNKLIDIRFEYFNDAYAHVSGLTLSDVQGKTVREVWPTTEESWFSTYEEVALTGVPKMFEMYHSPTHGLYSCNAYRPWDNRERVCCVFEDITARKKAEETLRESQERVSLALQGADLGSWDWNVQTDAVVLTERLTQMLGYKLDEIEPYMHNWLQLIHPEDLPHALEVINLHFEGKLPSCEMEFRVHHKNGSWVWILSKGKLITRDSTGQPLRAVGTHLDITERKLAEQERAKLQDQLQQAMKMEAIGRLAGGVAHDFNNLLTAIIGNIELAKMHVRPFDPIAQQLDQAGKAADSAATLTRQLLAFSRRQIIEPQILNLNDLISNLQKMLVRLIGEDITCQILLKDDIGFVKIDPGQFEQVIVNLAVNARDSMPNGGTLQIETEAIALDQEYCAHHPGIQPGSYVLLAVSDTGHGMSEEVKTHIFEPFFTTKAKGRGTGLGLATIFGAVKQAGGAIEVYSELEIGTTFKIYLPRVDAPEEKLIKENIGYLPQKGHETILLVEDEEAVRSMALKILELLGYTVLSAPNGTAALALAKAHTGHIDLLLTDVVMPGINGRELSQQLLTIHPETDVLFTSGYTEDVIVHHGVVDAGLNFIGKPYTVQTLAQKIRDVLDKPEKTTP